VLGSLSFVAFALLAIPDRIGKPETSTSSDAPLGLANALTPNLASPSPVGNWSSSKADAMGSPSPVSQVASRATDMFPKRGFTPPLERPDPPPQLAPPPPPPQLQTITPAPSPPPAAPPPPEPPPPMAAPESAPAGPPEQPVPAPGVIPQPNPATND
jgi:hypothetical protein